MGFRVLGLWRFKVWLRGFGGFQALVPAFSVEGYPKRFRFQSSGLDPWVPEILTATKLLSYYSNNNNNTTTTTTTTTTTISDPNPHTTPRLASSSA